MSKLFIFFLLVFCSISFADNFSVNASYQVCFSPEGQCAEKIVTAIDNARQQILVQAYSFNHRAIIRALVNARQRGVEVKILLDKDALNHRALLSYLKRKHLWLAIDSTPTIAHNKVMIIDQQIVITGSFNFTLAADKDNAENVLIIDDRMLAQKYLKNWYNRAKFSQNLEM